MLTDCAPANLSYIDIYNDGAIIGCLRSDPLWIMWNCVAVEWKGASSQMLTERFIEKVARLTEHFGEVRPGILQDSASPFEGSAVPCHAVGREGRRTASRSSGRAVRVNVVFETDAATGEIRAVQK